MSEKKEIVKAEAGAGNFGDCLVEGSAEDKKRGRKIKRRAIALSIGLQSVGLTALVIAPMLAKPAEIRTTSVMPIPPYSKVRPVRTETSVAPQPPRRVCVVCPQFGVRPIPPSSARLETLLTSSDPIGDTVPVGTSGPGGLDVFDTRPQLPQPMEPPRQQKRVSVGHIDPALLVNRVEPAFPPILKQLHRNGRVELHAIIAMDGTIQSLEVMSGDPFCVKSALDAVRQWRYRPTLLNGQPVEVDTFITVIYTVNSQ